MSNTLRAWLSGFTRRWHCHPVMSSEHDEVAAHQGRCVLLLLTLFPDASPDLVKATATHDAGEAVVGDIPFTHKDRPYAREIERLEDKAREEMGFVYHLEERDYRRLKFVDRLEAYLFVKHRRPHILTQKAWQEQREWLVAQWGELRVQENVFFVL